MPLSPDFLSYFSDLEDPRVEDRNKRHRLDDIFAIVILATICGADNWVEIVEFADARKDWLQEFLELPHGIPEPRYIGECSHRWMRMCLKSALQAGRNPCLCCYKVACAVR
ncbi:MAG: transposase family protein [Rhodospirillales bacterium]|nr:transposase family protein [Rhodospirillales bacterium]